MPSKRELLTKMVGQPINAFTKWGSVNVFFTGPANGTLTAVGEELFEVTGRNGAKTYFDISLTSEIAMKP